MNGELHSACHSLPFSHQKLFLSEQDLPGSQTAPSRHAWPATRFGTTAKTTFHIRHFQPGQQADVCTACLCDQFSN
jgi:hypothetical protein